LDSDPAWSDNSFPHRSVSGGCNGLLLFWVVDVLEVVLVSKLGNDRAIVVIGNLDEVGQPLEDDNVEITLDIGCSVSTSGAVALFGFGREVVTGGGGDGEDLDNFVCWVESKQSMLELLFPAAFNSLVFDDFIDDNDLSIFLLITLVEVLFSSSSKPPLPLLIDLLLTPPNGDNEAGLPSVSFSESEGKSYSENLASRSFCNFLNSFFGDNAFILDLENDFLSSFPNLFSFLVINFSFKSGSDLSLSNWACRSA
jgi:hypothetical protein